MSRSLSGCAWIASAFFLLGSADAQKVFSPSPSFATREGGRHCHYFGAYRSSRTQLADGNLRNTVRRLKGINYRGNYNYYGPSTGMGRTWRTVSLGMSEFDMSRMTNNASANVTGTPTSVFRGSVSWPSVSGLPLLRPAVTLQRAFPFATTWVYSGRADILCDYTFSGGRLRNNATWSGWVPYMFDSFAVGTATIGEQAIVGQSGATAGCRDPSNTIRHSAYAGLTVLHYGPNHATVQYRNKVTASYFAHFVGIGSSCITALGLKVVWRGITVPGVACQKLYVDFTGPVVLLTDTAKKSVGGFGTVARRFLTGSVPPHQVPVNATWIDAPLILQTAWQDTSTRQLKLTSASLTTVPRIPLWATQTQVRRKALYEYVTGTRTMRLGPADGSDFNPICCYGL